MTLLRTSVCSLNQMIQRSGLLSGEETLQIAFSLESLAKAVQYENPRKWDLLRIPELKKIQPAALEPPEMRGKPEWESVYKERQMCVYLLVTPSVWRVYSLSVKQGIANNQDVFGGTWNCRTSVGIQGVYLKQLMVFNPTVFKMYHFQQLSLFMNLLKQPF